MKAFTDDYSVIRLAGLLTGALMHCIISNTSVMQYHETNRMMDNMRELVNRLMLETCHVTNGH